MELNFEQPGAYLFIRSVKADAITVVEREFRHSFALGLDRVIEPWPVRQAADLSAADVEPLLSLAPEVLLLGTGQRQVFPSVEFLAGLLDRGIGVEVMDNAAAARTYGLLASEGRRVAAAFILGATE